MAEARNIHSALPLAERNKYIEDSLRWIVAHAYDHAPAVKQKMDKAGVKPSHIQTTADMQKIPITPKEGLVALQKASPPFGGFLAVPLDRVEKICVSPGPIYIPYADNDYAREGGEHLGLRRGDILVNTFAYMANPTHAIEAQAKQVGALVLPMGIGNTELQVQTMRELRATVFFGTSSFMMNIIQRAKEMGFRFPEDFSLRLAIITGEKPLPSVRQALERDYKLEVRDAYGTAEVGLIAYECPAGQGFHAKDRLFLEVVDTATGRQLGPGEVGEVVITPFNEVYPMVRYGTGDLSTYSDEPCPCGCTSRRLARIMGRTGDAVKVRGLFLHPKQVDEILARFPQVRRCQVVISREGHRDSLRLDLEMAGEAPEGLAQAISSSFQDICRLRIDKLAYVASLPETAKTICDERPRE